MLIADFNESTLHDAAGSLKGDGHTVTTRQVDVSSHESVAGLARAATPLGSVIQVAHTAGLSPAQAPAVAILKVDLLGVVLVLEESGRVVAAGGAAISIKL